MYTFDAQYEIYLNAFNAYLDEWCEGFVTRPAVLGESMKYSLKSGGKRIRPVLMLAVCDMLGGDMEAGLGVNAPIGRAEGTEGLDEVGMEQRLPAPEGDAAPRGQEVQVINFDPVVEGLGGDPLEIRLAVGAGMPGLGIEAELTGQGTAVGPHQGGHPRPVGGHAEAIPKGQGEGGRHSVMHNHTSLGGLPGHRELGFGIGFALGRRGFLGGLLIELAIGILHDLAFNGKHAHNQVGVGDDLPL